MNGYSLTHLQQLESESIHISRETVAECDRPVMLYSVGKDSAVMLHLACKAFAPGRLPFPLMHVDTNGKLADRQIIDTSKMKQFADELSTPADTATMEAAQRHAPSDRIVKIVVPAGDLLAVGYWGGTRRLLDKNGDVRTPSGCHRTSPAWHGSTESR